MEEDKTLEFHLNEVKEGKRRFENAFTANTRMVLEAGFDSFTVNGKRVNDYHIFRRGKKHMVAMYDEINSYVNFVKEAAEGGLAKEMAFALIGEPGNGKTFFVDTICDLYREFTAKPGNERYTFRFKDLDNLGTYGNISWVESQTFEDPMLLAMNLFGSNKSNMDENIAWLSQKGFSDEDVEKFFEDYNHLGSCTDFILEEMKDKYGTVEEVLKHIEVVKVPLSPTRGILTGKYSAGDKITSSAVDLRGEESLQRMMQISNTNNPYINDLRRGALARVAGGGIHFADELFKNKPDLLQIYLSGIQNRTIEKDGFKWPFNCLIIATSNTDEFIKFQEDGSQSPIISRCRHVYVAHNTNYKLQRDLTRYALGSSRKKTLSGEPLHEDPLLNSVISDIAVLTRVPESDNLTPEEIRKLAAGETAGEKGFKELASLIEELSHYSDVTKRFGQKGLEHRAIGKMIQVQMENSATHEGRCTIALDAFPAAERIIRDYVQDTKDQAVFLKRVDIAREIYRQDVKKVLFNAYLNDKDAIEREVMNYINIVIALADPDVGETSTYTDPQTRKIKTLRVDQDYAKSVESHLGLSNNSLRESHRTTIRKIYAARTQKGEYDYKFQDNLDLVEAVTEVKLNSDINGAHSLVGALADRNKEENQVLYDRVVGCMIDKLNFCGTCAEKTIEYCITKQDES